MIPLSLRDVAAVTSGRVLPERAGDVLVDGGVFTDSRECAPGSLYVARRGEHADGHDFVAAAADAGAVAALTAHPVGDLPQVVVDDVQDGFGRLGREVVDRCTAAGGLRIVGITGSSGKTSTKDLMAQVISELGPTLAPVESYNSEVGVPLTVCRLRTETAYLVAEMGASGVGHIEYLTRIAPPVVGVVLNVGSAHLGEFGSQEAIAHAKAELVRALPEHGLAVLNADDHRVAAMATQTAARVVLVGTGPQAGIRAEQVQLDELGRPGFTLVAPGSEPLPVQLALHGRHHVANALAVVAVAREWRMPLPAIADALTGATPRSRWRMQVTVRPDGVTVVNDAYNANPESMTAALHALAAMTGARRRLAVIGEMLELGAQSAAKHRAVGEQAAALGIDRLLAVGGAGPAAEGFGGTGGQPDAAQTVPDVATARTLLEDLLRPGDVVLLKSSRDSGLRHLGDALGQVVPPA